MTVVLGIRCVGVLLFIAMLWACGAADLAPGSGVDGPVLRHIGGYSGDGEHAQVGGVIQIEGDCLYLAFEEGGERYPVVWPASTTWNQNDGHVLLPNGESVGQGDVVDGGGGYHDVGDVQRTAGQEAAELAARCLDNQYGEVAVVNNQRDGIGRAEFDEVGDPKDDGQEQADEFDNSQGVAGKWFVDELTVDGERIQLGPPAAVTVTVDGGVISGTSACNQYIGAIDWSADGGFGRFIVSELSLTKMLCQDPVMEVERAFVNALQSVESYEAADGLYVADAGAGTGFHLRRADQGN